jgi:glycerol-3-phosphate acyltransferase PlsY
LALLMMGALLIYRHRENISKLLQGKESKLGPKAKG